MRKHVATILTMTLLLGPTPAAAKSILDQAAELASRMTLARSAVGGLQQAGGCDNQIVMQGANDAENTGTGAYMAGGFLLPIVMPIIAGGGNPSPPFATTMNMDGDEARCYSSGYGETLRERRTSAAWTGTWIGIGLYAGLIVLAVATGPDY